ncbi:hypothetical protein BACPEC_02178 [[Bacteroides] pectinophilus ATCC 43243]|uniref:Uncharacterized protein n=1 Tax=[Bacteroides] pectinophilus ATCC 43243 TaxID=483218 RepID=B7ASW9_9FIRM|nr:hypothetical protein BACPEC_02178 [[Bacteroides] pectinophilus ATCC 43243]
MLAMTTIKRTDIYFFINKTFSFLILYLKIGTKKKKDTSILLINDILLF